MVRNVQYWLTVSLYDWILLKWFCATWTRNIDFRSVKMIINKNGRQTIVGGCCSSIYGADYCLIIQIFLTGLSSGAGHLSHAKQIIQDDFIRFNWESRKPLREAVSGKTGPNHWMDDGRLISLGWFISFQFRPMARTSGPNKSKMSSKMSNHRLLFLVNKHYLAFFTYIW